jgi:hypothetical protein
MIENAILSTITRRRTGLNPFQPSLAPRNRRAASIDQPRGIRARTLNASRSQPGRNTTQTCITRMPGRNHLARATHRICADEIITSCAYLAEVKSDAHHGSARSASNARSLPKIKFGDCDSSQYLIASAFWS